MRKLLFFISIFITVSAFSFNLGGSVDSYFLTGSNYQDITFSIGHEGNNFNFFADLKAINDGKYKPSHPSVYYGNFYFFMKDGGMSLYNDFFRLNTGRINKKDPADSPYSLFLSSKENSAVSLDFSYEDDTFLYNTTYMELNKDSVLGYPDRGANYKHYGIKFGNLRVMYQESVVYVGEAFDTEYFINPIPTFFIQYVNSSSGKPWTHGSNANAIMGFLSDYKTENMYIYGQILVDDFNMNRFLLPEGSQNPDKIAVSSGFKIRNGNGFLGIYGAAATKYTFEPYGGYGVNTKYGYTFYPDTVYLIDNKEMIIENEDNYIGYYNGENNLSFMFDYDYSGDIVKSYSSLEYSISGSKSPANPWHEYINWTEGGQGTKFLDDSVLENKIVFKSNLKFTINKFLDINNSLSLGYVKNKLELVSGTAEDENSVKYFRPSDNNEFIFKYGIGFKFVF